MRSKTRVAALVLAAGLLAGAASPARAQYASGLSYHNPRTGFGYSQHWRLGRGYYEGGFSYQSPRRGYSAHPGYSVRPGYGYVPRHYGYVPRSHRHRHCW